MFAHPMEALEEVAETEERRDGLPQEEVLKGFWKTVVVLNVALLSLSLGVMLAYFERSPYS
ncbi:MAG: hypothetical protein SV760_04160, partial [Halobacteria archaeon]|nr:hypothetical protein [Halobacteria archaeon]